MSRQSLPDGDEIDLALYAAGLWRWRYVIAAVTLACGIGAFLFARLTPPTFEATVQMIVRPPATGSRGRESGSDATDVSVASMGQGMGVAEYRALLDNDALAAQVLDEAGRSQPGASWLTRDSLRNRFVIDTVPDTNILVVSVRMPEPRLAASVANRYATKAIERSVEAIQKDNADAENALRLQVDASREMLSQAEARLTAANRQAGTGVRQGVDDPQVRAMWLARFDTEYQVARDSYAEAVRAYEKQKLTVAGQPPPLQLLTEAAPPERPIGPRVKRTTGVGLLVGFVISVICAAVVVGIRAQTAQRRDTAPAASGASAV